MCNNEIEPLKSIMDSMSEERVSKLHETFITIGCILTEFIGENTPLSEELLCESITIETGIPRKRVEAIFDKAKKTYKEL